MNRILLLFIFLCLNFFTYGQLLKGLVKAQDGEPIPYANIFISELQTGTISGANGEYELNLPDSKEYTLVFQHLGFKSFTTKVRLKNQNQTMDVTLSSQVVQLSEVKVLATGEDPAYYVMRKAISLAPYYAKQVSEYRCKVYLKGTGVLDKAPSLLKKKIEKEGIKLNKPFVMENLSKFHFQQPNKIEQVVIAQRSSGNDNGTNPMEMVTSNLYETSNYGMVSPFDPAAFRVYRFRLEGVFEDQGRTINKIKIIPRRKGKDLFRGHLYIAEHYWNLHSAYLEIDAPMTRIKMQQLYAPVNKNTWMPVKLDFKVKFKGMGFQFRYHYIGSINEYKTTLNPKLNHDVLSKASMEQSQATIHDEAEDSKATIKIRSNPRQKEIEKLLAKDELTNRDMRKVQRLMKKETRRSTPPPPLEIKPRVKVGKNTTQNDSSYWTSIRPVKLSDKEKESFVAKDSITQQSKRPGYRDSVLRSMRRFKPSHLLFGNTYRFEKDSGNFKHQLKIPSIIGLKTFSYNTVDGLRIDLPFKYSWQDTMGRNFNLKPHFAYGFARKELDLKLKLNYRYNGLSNSFIGFEMGRFASDLNQGKSMPSLLNTVHTLFLEENYKKYFRKDYLHLNYGRELINGLDLNVSLRAEDRYALQNNSDFSFIDIKDKEFTINVPQGGNFSSVELTHSRMTAVDISLVYQFRRRYYLTTYEKKPVRSKYPILTFQYKKSIPNLLGSETKFDFLSFGLRHGFYTGHNDKLRYKLEAGAFFFQENMHISDFVHFTTFRSPAVIEAPRYYYRLLPYYEYSNNNKYISSNVDWTTDRLLLKWLPGLNNTLANEALFTNILLTDNTHEPYWEVGYGLRNLFFVLNVEWVSSFVGDKHEYSGIKVGLIF